MHPVSIVVIIASPASVLFVFTYRVLKINYNRQWLNIITMEDCITKVKIMLWLS